MGYIFYYYYYHIYLFVKRYFAAGMNRAFFIRGIWHLKKNVSASNMYSRHQKSKELFFFKLQRMRVLRSFEAKLLNCGDLFVIF